MIEQRKHVRRFTAINVDCYSSDGSVQIDKCVMVNISKGGLAIESKKHFSIGEKILVSFNTPESQEISVMTQILHSSQGGFGTLYGAKYHETDLQKLSALNNYLLNYFNLY
ncbi:MAG: PilZ domain-containing protein [Endomicrobia bacterium]|nr:PilZ domain-containing protein [Endomicrobiia bacterium]MCL2799488.1 PilZ domain-containing protein [Endomicrobiia bacterium]